VTQDRRLQYRVTPNLEREVLVSVELADGKVFPVHLVDVSAGGAGFGVVGTDALPVEAGQILNIRFDSVRLSELLVVPAELRHVKVEETDVQYGVSFHDWTGIRMNLAPKLRSLFNEREAVRVEPREDEEVPIRVSLGDGSIEASGLLRDISVLGLGLWVSAEDQIGLALGDNLDVHFTLPPSEKPLVLGVVMKHVAEVGEQVRLGLEIERQQPAMMNGTRRGITSYVMTRQMEVARIDAERRRAMLESLSKKD